MTIDELPTLGDMTCLAQRALVGNDGRYTTSCGNQQGRDRKERNSVWVLKGTGVVRSLENAP